MRAFQFKRAESVREITIDRFRGVNFCDHPTKVRLDQSPDTKNMIAAETDFLVKRTGYQCIERGLGKVFGLFPLPDGSAGALVHAESSLWLLTAGVKTELAGDMNAEYSTVFVMNGGLYLLDGRTYRVVTKSQEGWRAKPVTGFVPTTTIGAPPTGGGTSFEAVNLLTPRRINTFIGNGTATQFMLDAKNIDAAEVTATAGGSPLTVASVDRVAGMVTLATAPPNGGGLANVTITFSKTVAGNADKINRCRICGLYGGKNDTRVFLAGNPDFKNCDWQSGLYDPTYFPDTGYTRMGSDATAIVGYIKQYESQIVLKEGGASEATQYLRTFTLSDDGQALYPLKQGAQGAGAMARRSLAVLNDIPLFLSREGVMGVYGTAVAEQRNMVSVSRAVAPKLVKEPGLADACAVVLGEKYYLAVNGHVYVADGRVLVDGMPAWYFWDQLPITAITEIGGDIWFGTGDGRVCRFFRAEEEDAYYDDGQAIAAYWRTSELPLAGWGRVETIRELLPVLMPYSRSGVTIRYETAKGAETVLTKNLDLFSFLTMDFGRFSFSCVPGAAPIRIRRRLHRTNTFRVFLGNDQPGEPFGLLAFTVRYVMGQSV